MIRTFLQYTLIDIGINLMFDNIQKNFAAIPQNKFIIPDRLVSGCTCDVCYCMDKLEDGKRFNGNWYNQVYFNGYDQSTSTFYFMSYKGDFIDLHIDNIIDIYVMDESGDDMIRIHNYRYTNDETPECDD